MEAFSAQDASEKLATLIDGAVRDQRKYLIRAPEGNAVLLSEEAYNNLMITLEMFSTPLFIEAGQE